MKKFLCFILIFCSICFVACKQKRPSNNTTSQSINSETTSSTDTSLDSSSSITTLSSQDPSNDYSSLSKQESSTTSQTISTTNTSLDSTSSTTNLSSKSSIVNSTLSSQDSSSDYSSLSKEQSSSFSQSVSSSETIISSSSATSSSSSALNLATVTLNAGIFTEYFKCDFLLNDTPCLPIIDTECNIKIYSINDKLSIKSITINGTLIINSENYLYEYTLQNFTITKQIEIVVEFYKDSNNY